MEQSEILNKNTLVLNAAYMPIEKVHWTKAFVKVFQNRARAVEYYDLIVRSPGEEYFIPAVIVCIQFARVPRRRMTYSKNLVYERDSYLCQYCRKALTRRDATIDHVLPRSRGGKSTFKNCVCSCSPCNSRKANKTPVEARMRLIKEPKKPFIHPLRGKLGTPEPEWKNYLKKVY